MLVVAEDTCSRAAHLARRQPGQRLRRDRQQSPLEAVEEPCGRSRRREARRGHVRPGVLDRRRTLWALLHSRRPLPALDQEGPPPLQGWRACRRRREAGERAVHAEAAASVAAVRRRAHGPRVARRAASRATRRAGPRRVSEAEAVAAEAVAAGVAEGGVCQADSARASRRRHLAARARRTGRGGGAAAARRRAARRRRGGRRARRGHASAAGTTRRPTAGRRPARWMDGARRPPSGSYLSSVWWR